MSFVFLGRSLNCALVRFGPCRVNHPRACSSSNFMTENEFDQRAEDTLHALTDFFDALPDKLQTHTDYDVSYSMGVLTLHVAPNVGTYVINKQTPNRQIWLSSPISGPKRYDWVTNQWTYKHDGVSLHRLLETELSKIFSTSHIGIVDLK